MLAITLAASPTNLVSKKQKSTLNAARVGLPYSAPRLSPQTPFIMQTPANSAGLGGPEQGRGTVGQKGDALKSRVRDCPSFKAGPE